MDKIYLKNIKIYTIIGTMPHERINRQSIVIDLTIETSMQKASITDNLYDTVDYSAIEALTVEIAENSSFYLLEALAGAIGRSILDKFPTVVKVGTILHKFGVLPSGAEVILDMTFERSNK